MKIMFRSIIIFLLILIGINGVQTFIAHQYERDATTISYPELKSIMEKNKKSQMELYKTRDGVLQLSVGDQEYRASVESSSSVDELIKGYNVLYSSEKESKGITLSGILTWAIIAFLVIYLVRFLFKRAGQRTSSLLQFGKMNESIKKETPSLTMKDIGGLTPEAKEEIQWAIKLFKDGEKAAAAGVPATKAMLYHGPPGTGKTTIAKAMAGEMKASFYQTSGSEFVEMFVGVGASRVRNVFTDAKKSAPSVIFIDEFDAIGGKREATPGRGNKEAEQTLNQLLVELSELRPEDQVFVVAATNFMDKLDPALIRPGRFDYKVHIDLPDYEGRKEIIAIHTAGKCLADEVAENLDMLAKSMFGYSGADIEDVFKQASRKAFFDGRKEVDMADVSYAIDRSLLGSKGRPHKREDLKKRIAYHEAGHALVQTLTKRGSIRKASIAPRGNAGGVVITIPDEEHLSTRSELFGRLCMIVAGGVAEKMVLGEHSVGVSADLEQAKSLVEAMVKRLGMMRPEDMHIYFSDRDQKNEMEKLYHEALNQAQHLIASHRREFNGIAEALMDKETLSGKEIEAIVFSHEDAFGRASGEN